MKSTDPIRQHLRPLKKERLQGLSRLGIQTIQDLLYHFPGRYGDAATQFEGVLEKGIHVTLTGIIKKINKRRTRGRKRIMMAEASINTDKGVMRAVWFHQPYIAHQYKENDTVEVSGKLGGTKNLYLTNPIISRTIETEGESMKEKNAREELTAIYPETRDISSLYLRAQIEKILSEENIKKIEDPIPQETRKRLNLPTLYDALIYIHKPRERNEHEAAKKRFIFEHTFLMQINQRIERNKRIQTQAYAVTMDEKQVDDFMKNRFEFKPTNDQKRTTKEIVKDIQKNKPMARLLEGDVGSGKTAVAAAVIHGVVTAKPEERTSGRPQVAYLAPTEVLAKQQFHTLIDLFRETPIQIGYLSGKECLKYPAKVTTDQPTKISKTQLKKWIASGEIAVIVGTHALIQKDTQFKRLALIIVDEQHRFGVAQRRTLRQETVGHTPHLLSMTATPIPRTLALTMYGDLDISVIQKTPKERKPVKTFLIRSKEIQKVYDRIQKEIDKGHQAYVLCPRIQESEESLLRSVEEEHQHLSKNIFPHLSVGMLHGKMKSKEKQEIMEQFNKGSINILVCTTVVEVGVNVPNATIIAVLHAERFGLAQLHQLRGRVIRSNHQPYCCAITNSTNEITMERLKIFETTHNGFDLAEKDLNLRGSGELAGLRQSGIPDLAMEGLKNPKLLEIAQKEAETLVKKDPILKNHPSIRQYLQRKIVRDE